MEDRTRRIVETAIALAERDGSEAVRLRDVAAQANVALGTVYRRFRSKEDILVAALEHEIGTLQTAMADTPIRGDNAVERTSQTFKVMTQVLLDRPALARALLRAVSSGVPEVTEKVARFHGATTAVIVAMMHDHEVDGAATPQAHRHLLASMLQNMWFAELVGWAGGLHDMDKVVHEMARVTRFLLTAPVPEE